MGLKPLIFTLAQVKESCKRIPLAPQTAPTNPALVGAFSYFNLPNLH